MTNDNNGTDEGLKSHAGKKQLNKTMGEAGNVVHAATALSNPATGPASSVSEAGIETAAGIAMDKAAPEANLTMPGPGDVWKQIQSDGSSLINLILQQPDKTPTPLQDQEEKIETNAHGTSPDPVTTPLPNPN